MPALESKSKTYLKGDLITFLYILAIYKSIKKLIAGHAIAIKPHPDVCVHCKTLNLQISVLESVISTLLPKPVTRDAKSREEGYYMSNK